MTTKKKTTTSPSTKKKKKVSSKKTTKKTSSLAPKKPYNKPGAFTEDLAKALIKERRQGVSIANCAKACKVPQSTLEEWLKKGRNSHERYSEFALQFDSIMAAKERDYLAKLDYLMNCSDNEQLQAKIAMWGLEKMFPHQYGDLAKAAVQVNVNTQEPTHNLSVLTTEEVKKLYEIKKKTLVIDTEGEEVE